MKKLKSALPPLNEIRDKIRDKLDSNPDMSEDEALEIQKYWNDIKEHHKTHKLDFFSPFEYQEKFFNAGKDHRFRFLSAANQMGKTYGMGFEITCHLTGRYPWWWKGRKYNKPVTLWAVGITTKSVRDSSQKILLGTNNVKNVDEIGTGMIPLEDIKIKTIEKDGATCETVMIKHYNKAGEYDGDSELTFKSTQMGVHALMGATVDFILLDEEDKLNSMAIYTQCLARTTATKGSVTISASPENGKTDLVNKFYDPNQRAESMYFQMASLYDCPLFTEEEIEQKKLEYPKYEHGFRIYGDPSVSSGLIYPFDLEALTIDPIAIPSHWKRVAGVDLGWDHPLACIWSAYDASNDVIYVYGEYGKSQEVVAVHAQAIKSRGDWIPVILPHDSAKTDSATGIAAIDTWRNALPQVQSETFYNFYTSENKKNNSIEVGFDEIRQRMRDGRIKIFSTCPTLLSELRNYKMKDGKVYKYNDDYCDAFRYSVMSVINRGVADNGSSSKWSDISKTSAWNR